MRKARWTAFALSLMFACAVPSAAQAQAPTTIDFEQFSGPPIFTPDPHPPLTVGIATFSGGQILRNTVGLPINASSVYGTVTGCGNCQSTIAIAFARPIKDFSVLVMNGEGAEVSYTAVSSTGETQTKTLAPHFESGADISLWTRRASLRSLYGRRCRRRSGTSSSTTFVSLKPLQLPRTSARTAAGAPSASSRTRATASAS